MIREGVAGVERSEPPVKLLAVLISLSEQLKWARLQVASCREESATDNPPQFVRLSRNSVGKDKVPTGRSACFGR